MGVKKGKRKEKNRHQPYARVPQPEQREEHTKKTKLKIKLLSFIIGAIYIEST